MDKLYLRKDGRVVAYHEAWSSDDKIVEHWGPLGERGEMREHNVDADVDINEQIEQILTPASWLGLEPIDMEDHAVLLIEYAIDGMGTRADLDKRHALEERMNETLGWCGLGNCDGGSIGSGTMEVCCFVVDFEKAKQVIEDDLRDTEYSDYIRIYDERAE